MSIVIATEIDIAATPSQVWDLLSDFPTYGEWSNFSRIDGVPQEGTTGGFTWASFSCAGSTRSKCCRLPSR
ncbi:MAG: hypothetical protein JWQ65_147 [Devosia sp.]|nr:hypothetical protein [Devosia sp.]